MKASVLFTVLVATLSSAVRAFNDTDVLVFALNLECLEAEFYSWAAYGKGLDEAQRGGGPESIGGMMASLGNYSGVAAEIATEEIQHVEYLRAALGASAPPCPKIDIGPAFSAAANAALNTTLTPAFSPYDNYVKFLHGALLFEDVGVMAYNGAIDALQTPAYKKAARSIMAVEAYHAGIIRENLAAVYNVTVDPYGAPVSAIVGAISTTLDTLLGLNRSQPVGDLYHNPTNLTPTNASALAYAITPAQVLNVVYLSPNATTGGFFPEGIQGLLNSTRGVLDAQVPLSPAPVAMMYNWTDADILNFALNLECLEAEYYSWAAFGKGLNASLTGGGPASVGGVKANLTVYQAVAEEIANEEIEHVAFLRKALGAAAVPCPAIDIGPAFAAAANAALNTTLPLPFTPYTDYIRFLHGALLFEDVGVMAYNGAIEALNNTAYKAAARSIMAVEAYHAGIVRNALANVTAVTVDPYNATVSVIVGAIGNAIDGLLTLNRSQNIGSYASTNPNLIPTDANGLAYTITPRQTLNVVYLAPNATMGGFFPEGVNGAFNGTGELSGISTVTAASPTIETPTSGPANTANTASTPPAPAASSGKKLSHSITALASFLIVALACMA